VLRRLTASTWGNFGWLEVQLAEPVRLRAAAGVTAALALAVARRLDAPWARPAAAVALAAFCVQLAVVGQQSLKNYLRGGYFAGLQGRYLYAFVGVVAALVAVGLARVVPRRVLPLVALAAVVVLQAVGALTALDGFWWPEGEGVRRALAVQAAWAPSRGPCRCWPSSWPWRARCCWRRGWSPTVLLPRCGGDPRSTLLWPGAGPSLAPPATMSTR
jgi:hypothetical protein